MFWIRVVIAAVCASVAGLTGYLYYSRYWLHRDCIEAAETSCLLPDGDTLSNNNAVWLGIAVVFAAIAIVSAPKSR